MVLLQASGSHHICIKYISASLREDGISRTICGLPMASPLSLSEVCSKFLGIKTFHLVGRLVQMQDVKEEVKQQYSLRGGETVYPAEKLHNHRKHTTQSFRKSLKLTRFTTPQASTSSQNCCGGGSQTSGAAWRSLSQLNYLEKTLDNLLSLLKAL